MVCNLHIVYSNPMKNRPLLSFFYNFVRISCPIPHPRQYFHSSPVIHPGSPRKDAPPPQRPTPSLAKRITPPPKKKISTMENSKSNTGIPGVSFSWKRALGITQAKQKFAKETGIPTSKAGWQRKIGEAILKLLFGKRQ